MRRHLTRLALLVLVALVLVGAGGLIGRLTPVPATAQAAAPAAPADRLQATISRYQQRLRDVPGDWRTWAALGSAYLEWARVSADPTYYPKAEGAAQKSLSLRADGNADALVALGTLAAARHDFGAARDKAVAALAVDPYDADAYGVLADARTQLGDAPGATDAVQHMLDLRPGLPAYARASYDLEQRGRVQDAESLMRQALDASADRHGVVFCRTQLGDLAWQRGDLAGAQREYEAAFATDPSTVAGQRGRARVAFAAGRTDTALADYAALVRRAPTPGYLLEYAELLRASGHGSEAATQLALAATAQKLFTDNGGVDGLAAAALAMATGDTAEAVRQAQGEWSRRQFADVADTLGWALHLAGRDAEALSYVDRATATGSRNASYAYHLGAIEAALGRTGPAKADLNRALTTNPYFSPIDAPQARRLLGEVSNR
jgi:tetratricopeptide (TPR) repeat protein